MIDEMDLLRSARPLVLPPSDRTRDAARRALQQAIESERPRRRRFGANLGRLATAALIAVPVLITVAALVLLGARSRPEPVAAAHVSRQQLVRIIGALRRPQTRMDLEAEKLPFWRNRDRLPQFLSPDLPLVRYATTTRWGEKLYFVPFGPPAAPAPGRSASGTRSVAETLMVVSAQGVAAQGTAAGIQAGRAYGERDVGREDNMWSTASSLLVIVPDGVAKVTFVLPRQPNPFNPQSPIYAHTISVTVPVHENVAAVQVGRACCTARLAMIWYGAHGRVVKRIGNLADASRVTPKPVSPERRPLPAALVTSFHVFKGLRVDEYRFIADVGQSRLWVMPGRIHVCLVESPITLTHGYEGNGGDCVPNRMALAGEMSPIAGGPGGVTVTGLAPNGNRTVTLVLGNGSPETVPVHNNIYVAHSRHGFKTVTLKDSRGQLKTYRVPDGG